MSDLIGTRLGKFEITGKLGEGGMATVYRARDTTVGRDVAIKVIIAKLADNPDLLKRFEREARTVATLDHPHILKIFEVGQQDNLLYLVMELKTGGSLAGLIRSGTLPVERVARLLSQIASALDYAHENGIVHRDLKPQNVLLDAKQNAILTDFGIAKVQQADMTALTMTGMAMGTPSYMAPEQWQGGMIDARTDIYALGIMLFEMLTGRVPFTAETPYQMMFAHVQQQPPTVREVRGDVKPPIDQVVLKALAKDPAHRYGSAGELAAAFRGAVGGDSYAPGLGAALGAVEGATSSPTPAPGTLNVIEAERIPTAKGTQTLPIAAAKAAAPATPNRPPLALIAGGIAIVLIGVVAVLLLASRPPSVAGTSTTAAPSTIAATTAIALLSEPSATLTSTLTSEPTHTATIAPISTSTATPLPPTATPSATLTATNSPSPSATTTHTASATTTPTMTPSVTATATQDTARATAFAIATGAAAASATAAAASPTPNATHTFTHTATASVTASHTSSATSTASATNTVPPTQRPAITATPIVLPATLTPLPPTLTATVTATRRPPTATSGPNIAITATPLVLPTDTPTAPAVALNTTTSRSDGQGIAQVWIEAACFEMGSTEAEITDALTMGRQYNPAINRQAVADELPSHDVCFSKGYWIDVYEVTNAAFQQFVDAGGYSNQAYWSTDGWAWVRRNRVRGPATDCGEQNDVPALPKTCVSWYEAEAYATWRGGRLPTEAEWEYAARGKDRTIFPWGNSFDGTRLNYCDVNCQNDWRDSSVDDGYAYHAPVGSYPSGVSWCGAHDMAGNVWEWTQDWYNENTYERSPNNDPTGPTRGISRVLRGGSRGRMSESVRGANRFLSRPTDRVDGVGFRIVSGQ